MTLCLVITIICALLYCVCRVAVAAPSAKTLREWIDSILCTFVKHGEFTLMKKIFVCVLVAIMVFTTTAYADSAVVAMKQDAYSVGDTVILTCSGVSSFRSVAWYRNFSGDSAWYGTNYKTLSISFEMTEDDDEVSWQCRITTSNGSTVLSNIIMIH